mgnify:CR=1 FL=1
MYNVDFNKLAAQLLPPFLRKVRLLAWIRLMFFPLRYLNDLLISFINLKRLEISYNCETMVMERALNNTYPGASGGIYINNDVEVLAREYSFFFSENQGSLGFSYFYSEGNGSFGSSYFASEYATSVDFIVLVPNTLVFDENEMIAFVKKYKSAGKLFKIQTY